MADKSNSFVIASGAKQSRELKDSGDCPGLPRPFGARNDVKGEVAHALDFLRLPPSQQVHMGPAEPSMDFTFQTIRNCQGLTFALHADKRTSSQPFLIRDHRQRRFGKSA